MVKNYIPEPSDISYIDFDPTLGHEQKGVRPCIVVSNETFNRNTHMAIVCPITSNTKPFPTHHILKSTNIVHGAILCEHIRSVDYSTRNMRFVEKISTEEYEEVIELITACLETFE